MIATHRQRPPREGCYAEAMGIPADGSDVSTDFILGLDPVQKHR